MKIFTFCFHKSIIAITFFLMANGIFAQTNDSLFVRIEKDTTPFQINLDATYNRPFLAISKTPVALGGYLEVNSLYSSEEGISEGLSFQARRLTMFMSASIAKRIKFLSEIEFEGGTKEINIEFAALDIQFHPLLNLRGGIILNPIGAFNQNHDGPNWEFVERPDMAANMLSATWSNAGFGLFGKAYHNDWVFGYEAYLSNGFDDSIIDNDMNKTFLPAAKNNEDRFEESSNGQALFSGKVTLKQRKIAEVGFSYMGGIYNTFEAGGLVFDEKRRLDVFALDFNTTLKKLGTYITAEAAFVNIDLPAGYTQQYGDRQFGFFADIVQPVLKREIFNWKNATLNLAFRLDYVDWNDGKFRETNESIGDELIAITPAVSFRPTAQTVFRLNYRYEWQRDVPGNPPVRRASWLFGFSSYF